MSTQTDINITPEWVEVIRKCTEMDIFIADAWLNYITLCKHEFPHGDIKVRIVNSLPTDVLEMKPKIRLDKKQTIPKNTGRISLS